MVVFLDTQSFSLDFAILTYLPKILEHDMVFDIHALLVRQNKYLFLQIDNYPNFKLLR